MGRHRERGSVLPILSASLLPPSRPHALGDWAGPGSPGKTVQIVSRVLFPGSWPSHILHGGIISNKVQRRLDRSSQPRESCLLQREGHFSGLQHTEALSSVNGRAAFPATG